MTSTIERNQIKLTQDDEENVRKFQASFGALGIVAPNVIKLDDGSWKLAEEEEEEEEEREYEYSHCGEDKDTGEIIVAGGGMMNGNAYATIKIIDDCTVLYREYGKNACSKVYRNSQLEWCDEGYSFDVVPC